MYTQAAETMWSSLTDKLNDYNHLLELALFGLDNFLQSFQNRKLLHSNFGKMIELLSGLNSFVIVARCC